MPSCFRQAMYVTFPVILRAWSTRGFSIFSFSHLGTTSNFNAKSSWFAFNTPTAVSASLCTPRSRARSAGPEENSSSRDDGSSLIEAGTFPCIDEFEKVPGRSASNIPYGEPPEINAVRNSSLEDTNISLALRDTPEAMPPLAPSLSSLDVRKDIWLGRSDSQQETIEFGGLIESLTSSVESAAVSMNAVPLKSRADGRLNVNGQGLLNLCILVFSALWAIYAIATVDATVWRGWTLQETLLRLPWDNWNSYEAELQEHPIFTKTFINVVIYLIGDWLAQVNWGRNEDVAMWEFDLGRTLRNGLIGAMFGPLVHYYYDFSDYILPPNVGTNRLLKIVMDQSIYFVTKCAVYISLVSLLRGDSWEETKETVEERLGGVVTTGWRFWPFVHIFTYFLIPPRHRVLWVNCVDLLWSSILASMASGTPDQNPDEGQRESDVNPGA